MADTEQNKKDFATSGTESFNLTAPGPVVTGGGTAAGEVGGGVAGAAGVVVASAVPVAEGRIVLNIREDNGGVILNKSRGLGKLRNLIPANFFGGINQFLIAHSSINDNIKSTFYHLLSVMINAGIPMVNALKALAQQEVQNPRMMMIVYGLAEQVEAGKKLSDAMFVHPDIFAEKDIGMVRSGEASGQLANTLENLANDTLKAYEIKGKIKSAMTYPIVVMGLLLCVFVVMMIFVIPKLTELFSSFGKELPLLTRVVVGMSNFMVSQKLLLAFGVIALLFAFSIFRKTDFGRYYLDLFKLKVPLFGQLFRKAYLSRFARSLSNLLSSGLSIVTTLEIVANSVGNEIYRKKLLLATEDIKQGIPLAETLAESDFFPPMLLSMIEVGEKTAQLDTILNKVADFYENEVSTSINGLSKLLEPLILVVIGVSVGLIVGAIMMPIMDMSSLAGGV
ncbi:MAG: type II secretion system F family protein [Candidatus Gracilibacteria bacterium]|jgi:type IV pilus assembly protein PilC